MKQGTEARTTSARCSCGEPYPAEPNNLVSVQGMIYLVCQCPNGHGLLDGLMMTIPGHLRERYAALTAR